MGGIRLSLNIPPRPFNKSLDQPRDRMKFKNRDEVIKFEVQINAYEHRMNGFKFNSLSIVSAYDFCQDRESDGKLFSAFTDLYLNVLLLSLDIASAGSAWNKYLSKKDIDLSGFNDPEIFLGRAEVFRFNSSFILRYRAFLDKFMGTLVLYYSPEKYESFLRGKSRRKSFSSALSGIDKIPQEFFENIKNHIDSFDNEFRTAEAHGTGALRKYSFMNLPLEEDPAIKLLKQYNMIIILMELMCKLFERRKD